MAPGGLHRAQSLLAVMLLPPKLPLAEAEMCHARRGE